MDEKQCHNTLLQVATGYLNKDYWLFYQLLSRNSCATGVE